MIRLGPNDETPRERLITALGVAMTVEQACAVVDALEAYLDEGERGVSFAFENLTPNYSGEIEKLRVERDAAVALAERALQEMQRTLGALRGEISEPKAKE